MGGDMVEVRDIRKSYGRKLVLDGVGFSAQPGEQIALVGRNGCEKLLPIISLNESGGSSIMATRPANESDTISMSLKG